MRQAVQAIRLRIISFADEFLRCVFKNYKAMTDNAHNITP